MRPRKIPLRKCVACQEMMSKKELIRVVRTPDEEVLIDLTGKKAGRGAYLCGKVECFKLAKKAKSLDRALKQTVGEDIYDGLEREFIKVQDTFIASRDRNDDDDEA
ncbi:YlxR family protein [Paenibacillus oenotherae]|uniref:YlxR family protein n=1 Tax=Paenibacillus oenotherae TaxID=1435645 RepID=A0ABS7D1J8_9BACL|nr:YlxR family protein [Paenibacillus oenotherae]MBW7473256.1 YlxR family protein [Paenibacillus oenotherae]